MAGFVCIYYGNTGSSWLLETLSTSSQVFVPGFEPLERWAWKTDDEVKVEWMRSALTPPADTTSETQLAEWAARLSASPQFHGTHDRTGFTHVGWKMTWGAVDDQTAILDVLAETRSKAIVLGRENRVKHALSLYRYHDEGKSQFDKAGERPPSTVPKEAMDRWLRESQRLHDENAAFARKTENKIGTENLFELSYEQFVDEAGKESTIRRVATFLGLDDSLIKRSGFQKATPDDLRSALTNYEELRRAYRFSKYRRFFAS